MTSSWHVTVYSHHFQSPNLHFYTDQSDFPDATMADAMNYCRSPHTTDRVIEDLLGPWCYVMEFPHGYGYCDVPWCLEPSGKSLYWRHMNVVAFEITGKTRLFVQRLVRAPGKEKIKALPNWTFVRDGHQWRMDFLHHDDVIKWKHFPRYWPFVRGIHRGPVNSPHKGQWCGALMFWLIYVWINGWVNNHEAGDLRRYRIHCDVIVMTKGQ